MCRYASPHGVVGVGVVRAKTQVWAWVGAVPKYLSSELERARVLAQVHERLVGDDVRVGEDQPARDGSDARGPRLRRAEGRRSRLSALCADLLWPLRSPRCGRSEPQARCSCGRGEPSPGADVGAFAPRPSADVGGVGPVPVPMWQAARAPKVGNPTFRRSRIRSRETPVPAPAAPSHSAAGIGILCPV
jgi:hypothetical protein